RGGIGGGAARPLFPRRGSRRMNRRAALALPSASAAALAWLLLAAAPLAAQPPEGRIPFDGTQAFRQILDLLKLQPLTRIADLGEHPADETVLIVFGDLEALDRVQRVTGGLELFRQQGGAMLIATDRPTRWRLSTLDWAVPGTVVKASADNIAYRG